MHPRIENIDIGAPKDLYIDDYEIHHTTSPEILGVKADTGEKTSAILEDNIDYRTGKPFQN